MGTLTALLLGNGSLGGRIVEFKFLQSGGWVLHAVITQVQASYSNNNKLDDGTVNFEINKIHSH